MDYVAESYTVYSEIQTYLFYGKSDTMVFDPREHHGHFQPPAEVSAETL